MSKTTGMLLGKFLPPHRGHQYLFDFAGSYVDQLNILACSIEAEPIPGQLRYRWVREMAPFANVIHSTAEVPQYPHESTSFWQIWGDLLRKHFPGGVDYVFASEEYGRKVAGCLDAEFVPVDIDREMCSISSTAIRKDPLGNWEFLPDCVKPYYLKRVCIFGPESTGKSTLARKLAEHYDTVYVHEYARPYLDPKGGKCEYSDIERIVRGQAAAENALARQANRIMFCDTDNLTTTIWSEVYFKKCEDWIYKQASGQRYDLTLLLDVDVPWVDDSQRDLPHVRTQFFEKCRSRLDEYDRPYVIISGDWDERLEKSIIETDKLLVF